MNTDKKEFGLGQGLSTLLGSKTSRINTNNTQGDTPSFKSENGYPNSLPLSSLRPNKWQPRKKISEESIQELADSISVQGVLQPILVRPVLGSSDEYEIVAGERRWRASKKANLSIVPVVVKSLDDKQSAEIALVENLQREDLSPLDEAIGYEKLMQNFGYTQDIVSRGIGKSRSYVANMLRLLSLPDFVKNLLDTKQISMGHARTLISADNPIELAKEILTNSLNVRETEKLVKADNEKKGLKKNITAVKDIKIPEPVRYASEKFSIFFSKKIKISHGKGKNKDGGVINIEYKNIEDLEDIVKKFKETN